MRKKLFAVLFLVPMIMGGKQQTPNQGISVNLWKRVAVAEAIAIVTDSGEITTEKFHVICGLIVMTMEAASSPEELQQQFSTPEKTHTTYQRVTAEVFDALKQMGCLTADSSAHPAVVNKPDPGL